MKRLVAIAWLCATAGCLDERFAESGCYLAEDCPYTTLPDSGALADAGRNDAGADGGGDADAGFDAGGGGGTDAGDEDAGCTDPFLPTPTFGTPVPLPHFSEPDVDDLTPTYSPGAHLVCASRLQANGSQRIRCERFTLEGDGGYAPMQAYLNDVPTTSQLSGPSLNHDGSELYYDRFGPGLDPRIYLTTFTPGQGYGFNGSVAVFSAVAPGHSAAEASADSTEVFLAVETGANVNDLFVSPRSGESHGALTGVLGLNTAEDETHPALSPDGRFILYSARRSGLPRMFLAQRRCGAIGPAIPVTIPAALGAVFWRGDWGPDGGLVVEHTAPGGTTADIYFVPRNP